MKKIMVMILSGVLLSGYAQASDQKSLKKVNSLVKEQTGYEVKAMNVYDQEIEHLLSQPLTEDGAVAIAFLNSPVIKAQLSSLGISEADMREAGILRNPKVLYKTRTSDEEGSKRNTEIEIKQDVFDLLLWPLRKKIAGTRFQASQYEAAHQMTDFIKDVRLSYLEWLTAMHKQTLADDYFKAQEASLEIARRQKEAGNINTLKMTEAQAMFQKAKIESLKTKQETQTRTERLRTMLGLKPDQFFMEETVQIPDLPKENLVVTELEKKALDRRLDLLVKRQEIKTLEQSQNLSGLGFFPDVEVGYNQESETSGIKLKGVVVEGEVPLFNRKQAERMGSKASLETSKHQLDAMEQQTLLEVRLAYQDLMTSRQIVEAYKEAMPAYQQMIKETLYEYNFMLTDVFHLLESKQAELETKKEYVDALKGYWASRIELENAVGEKLDFDVVPPAEMKKEEQPKVMNQEHHHGG
ncbi:MAG: TolC family protein [Candidatus Omnitrophica bacterium]|nr:TolC family protein [Candidatus Omnitrophota bacterium]